MSSESPRHLTDSVLIKNSAISLPSFRRSWYIFSLVLLYTVCSIFSWVITCILCLRPITISSYGVNQSTYINPGDLHTLYKTNEGWFRFARVLQAVVTILTIPIATAVCANAAVIFTQSGNSPSHLSLRQLMVLADKGWSDIPTLLSFVLRRRRRAWKRYGSSFLGVAIALHLVGFLIAPLQQTFLSSAVIKIPSNSSSTVGGLHAFSSAKDEGKTNYNSVVVLTREALTTAAMDDLQANI